MKDLTKITLSKKTGVGKQEFIDTILSHLEDSYFLLAQNRADMAFSHLWKAINGGYNKLIFQAYVTLPTSYKEKDKISDSSAIKFFLDKVNSSKILPRVTPFIAGYAGIFPEKQSKYIANTLLKGHVLQESSLDPIFKNHHYSKNLRKNHKTIVSEIEKTYGKAYLEIMSCDIIDGSVVFNLKEVDLQENKKSEDNMELARGKSRQIVGSLASKILELVKTGKTQILDQNKKSNITLSLSDTEMLDFLFRGLLYTTRNTIIHGNTISRYASNFKNDGTIESSNYIYILGHFFLTLILLLTGDLDQGEFDIINNNNLSLAKTILL